jgi:mannan polymerase II complex MNN11 subunit
VPLVRRSHLKTIVLFGLGIIALIWLFSGGSKHAASRTISGKPPVVVVTVFDDKYDNTAYSKHIEDNRIQYAEKHGKRLP